MAKKSISIKIDLKEIQSKLEKYIYKKVQQQIRDQLDYDGLKIIDLNLPDVKVSYPDIERRLEKIEDWKLDIEQGWIKIDNDDRTKKKM